MARVSESIYNLIPREEEIQKKPDRYKSKFSPKIPPTYSTLCHKTTTRPGVTNPRGSYELEGGTHSHKGLYATIGTKKGVVKPNPNSFSKKGSGAFIQAKISRCHYPSQERKPQIPAKDDKPILGLVSDKNYVISNAVENILSVPKNSKLSQPDYLKKKDYGQIPKYIEQIKKDVEDEYQIVKELQIQEEDEKLKEKFLMQDEERRDLIAALKKKWEIIHHQYQEITHITKIDTISLKRKSI